MACQLIRDTTGPDGTFGKFKNADTQSIWESVELEWNDNKPDISCIPPGIYPVEWRNHPKHGWCYEVLGVPNRTSILIHSGNFAGQTASGEKSDFLGCIGLGEDRAKIIPPGYANPQEAVELSRQAISEFEAEMKQQPFKLVITNEWSDQSGGA